MLVLALILSLSLSILTTCLSLFQGKTVAKLQRTLVAERQKSNSVQKELLDRLMHVTGKTWVLPPAQVQNDDGEIDEETKLALEGWREV